ncbi:L-idonate 5-dehydrogenase [Escherichia coli]|nr:L-idonate 5-dehydrogenase [Escherichia coli]
MQVKTQSCVVAGKKTVAVTEQTIDWNNNGTLVQITRGGICGSDLHYYQEGKVGNFMIKAPGNDSNLLIVFYVQIMPDDFVMQLHRF